MAAQTQRTPEIAAVILAAGGSTRMGELKQLLPLGGKPMVRHTTEAVCAAGLAQVVVVVGAQAEAVQGALDGLPVEFVVNEAWAAGMSTSLRVGLDALRPEVQAALVVLADQPALTPDLLCTLVDRYRATGAPLVVPFYQGRRGNPVLVDRRLFPEWQAVEGDQGGRALLARHRDVLERVDVDEPAVVLDVDTRQDYEKAQTWKLKT
jgi:molybdenum cofactor cytidylyltransferase